MSTGELRDDVGGQVKELIRGSVADATGAEWAKVKKGGGDGEKQRDDCYRNAQMAATTNSHLAQS